jgi:lysophospholipase L1-like esterase
MRTENRLAPLLLIPVAVAWVCGSRGAAQGAPPVPGMVYVDTVHPGQPPIEPADQPLARTDANSLKAHQQLMAKRTQGKIDLYFMGDSITRRWGASDRQYADLLRNWNENFKGWNAADFGWGADKTQNMLWRLQQGELDGVNPKVIVLMAGTNNIGNLSPTDDTDVRAAETVRGVAAVVKELRTRAPNATIVLMGITPRNDNIQVMPVVAAANRGIAKLADGRRIRYLNINAQLADGRGVLLPGMTSDGLHLTAKAYQLWADALKPVLVERLGPKAQDDQAPPPTGDPAAAH